MLRRILSTVRPITSFTMHPTLRPYPHRALYMAANKNDSLTRNAGTHKYKPLGNKDEEHWVSYLMCDSGSYI